MIKSTVYESVLQNVELNPQKTALIYNDTKISYSQMMQNSKNLAKKILKLGIDFGDRIAYALSPSPYFYYTLLASSMIGVTCVGIAFRNTAAGILFQIEESKPKAIIVDDLLVDTYKQLGLNIPLITTSEILTQEDDTFNNKLEVLSSKITPDTPLIIIYTSGSTSKPKGAILTNKNVLGSVFVTEKNCVGGINSEDVFVHCFPVNHVSGAVETGIFPILVNGTVILYDKFNPLTILEDVEKYHSSVLSGVPAMWTKFLECLSIKKYDLSSIRQCVSGASPLPNKLAEKIFLISKNCTNPLGMTETSGLCSYFDFPTNANDLFNTIGKVSDQLQYKIVDAFGNEVKQGEVGEIRYKGDAIITNYVSKPADIDSDGFFKTGDLCFEDDRKYIHMAGRNDNRFTVGGYNVSPEEVESVLTCHKNILSALVMPIPHHSMGSVCRAYIMVKDKTAVDFNEIIDFASKYLIYYKVPKDYVIVDSFAINALGKIQRANYKQMIKEEFGA